MTTSPVPCPDCLTPPGKPLAREVVSIVDLGEFITMDKYLWKMVKRWLQEIGGAKVVETIPHGNNMRRVYATRPGPKTKEVH
jgi:hypothetical protein